MYLLVSFHFLSSCQKEDSLAAKETFIKTVVGDSDVVAISSLRLNDGNFLIVSSDRNRTKPGTMVKVNLYGKIIWEKRVSNLTNTIHDVLLLPGERFAILGNQTENLYSKPLLVGIYNYEGELITTRQIPTNVFNNEKTPFEVIQLSNNNFAFTGSGGPSNYSTIIITDNNFNLISIRSLGPSGGFSSTVYIRGICETQNGDIIITGSINTFTATGDPAETFKVLMRTDLAGITKGIDVFADSGYSETPNCLINYKEGALGISARMSALNNINGTFVYYLNPTTGALKISGRISLCLYDKDGQLVERKDISEYPNNGQISSIKSTSDGGFILCGTVDQANSAVLVSPTKIFLVKIDANLNVQWSKIVQTTYPSYGVDAIQMDDGGYLVSGHQRSFNNHYDAVIIKTDENGNY